MDYPFYLDGNTIHIYRYKVCYPAVETIASANGKEIEKETTKERYFSDQDSAEQFSEEHNGEIVELNTESYEWVDGLEIPASKDPFQTAVSVFTMGHEKWMELKREEKQEENNFLLADHLRTHHLTWKDGKEYGVTQQDQQELALNLTQYNLAVSAGLSAKLEWHAVHEECREFTVEELSGLAVAISEYVYPLVRKNQSIKSQIYLCDTEKELKEIVIAYEEAE